MLTTIDNRTLSLIISGRLNDVNWEAFSEDEWNFLIAKAQTEGVAPLVYWVFSHAQKLPQLPPFIRDSLRLMYASAWAKNRGNFKELETLTRTFAQANISIVALKGLCYALTIYPDIGLRPMGDLDVLVPKSRFEEAVEIARSLGYIDLAPEASPGLRELLNHEVCLKKAGGLGVLEIHHSLVADKSFSYAVPVDWFWEQVEPLVSSSSKIQIENLLMLTPVAQLLYAAGHAMLQHGGQNTSLCWYYDLDQIIRHYDGRVNWDLLLSQAKTFEWISALDAALSQTRAYFDTPVPDRVRANLAGRSDRHRDLVALKQVRPATHVLAERQTLLSLNWYGRFRLVIALVFPTPAYMRWRYQLKNSWTLPYYYLFRWWVIFKDLLSTIKAVLWPPTAEPGGFSE